ncbi:DISARM system helicase DrmA [Ancylothrix sp. C2]|uniref:DISARM system helicase DrmA n=1 Tax=Ancylothrix sp. D3o TaxID=2953691 RepID=UPI0021BA6DEA|nr:DISARM system helicase DrmA [Ancylothrix sp. D3o]MCT7953079.1 DISARM system helicase DrmA [Ancylothrix sp. D3o]
MNILQLPSILPGDLDLAAINQQLRERTAQLDWSAVVSAPEAHLAILLEGLKLDQDADVLDLEDSTMSETIALRVVEVLQNTKPKTKKSSSQPKPASPVTPAVWKQSPPPEPPLVTSEAPETEEPASVSEIVPVVSSAATEKAEKSLKLAITESNSQPILERSNYYRIRENLEQAILDDLLGPAGGEYEEIDEMRVSDRYLVGLLAPTDRRIRPEELEETREQIDELAVAGSGTAEEGTTENSIPPAEKMFPSSMGMTFCVDGTAKAIKIKAGWGQYERIASETIFKEDGKSPKTVWKRTPISGVSNPILLKAGNIPAWIIHPDYEKVIVSGQIRKQGNDWIVTLFLINGQQEPDRLVDKAWLFQPQLIVESADNYQPDIFIKRRQNRQLGKLDPALFAEEQAMAMLYRNCVEFAVGHGTGVHTETLPENPHRAIRLSTKVVPAYEVPQTTPPKVEEIPGLAGLVLDMKQLAEIPDLSTALGSLTTAYTEWISQQTATISDPASGLAEYQDAAKTAMENCEIALQRIQAGIDLLQTDNNAAEAFRFMNRAMWQQRIHSIYAENKRRGDSDKIEEIDIPKNRTWRPFQLAFILLNLPSITQLDHRDRCHPTEAIADLLWFPTGGGKTEAYLGLTAYTIGLRRLQGTIAGRSGEAGVAVLMRYTLRLLTLQQFQRATALICACEEIRRQDEQKWGKEPFRIGLWVGMKTTPNRTEQSEEILKQKFGQYQPSSSGSPHQLTNCPWCGSNIDPGKQHIKVESFAKGQGRTLIYCGDALGRCLFTQKQSPTEGLPIVVVDEEIYRRLPTLLIATVDKFAQMPWNGAVQMLFGKVDGYCTRHGFRSPEIEDSDSHPAKHGLPTAKTIPTNFLRPPDLIIQDELHLISGPLGTLVGLYETAVDKLASWEVNGKIVRPKVIASTATIRQARDQVHNLFLRQVQVFPPQGLNITDNFFSRQRVPSANSPGRRYLGICATGRRLKAALIRVYTAVLAASQDLFEKKGDIVDPWMTLVGYFNSMRELGGTRRLVDDDIQSRLGKTDQRGLAKRLRIEVEELTSRKNSTDIPIVLDWLETPFSSEKPQKNNKRKPLDVLLATNMISVGVDVKRLGVMVVTGQPKTTAEYIQATSRVGRTFPGLVLTVYNWARPRDLSHYEQFEHYHATFYQHVEALSITPFAPRAVDRGLAALLVSLIRLAGSELNANHKAGTISRDHPFVQAAIDTICNRAWAVGDSKTRDLVKQELQAKLDYWLEIAGNPIGGRSLKYQTQKDGLTITLLEQPGQSNWQPFTCLNSLRNVEPTIALILDDRLPDDDYRPPQPLDESSQID